MLAVVAAVLGLSSGLEPLRHKLDSICSGFHGRIGYCITDLKSGAHISLHGDDLFPTASTIKVAVALEALREVDEGKLKWTDQQVVPPLSGREASMWSYFFKDGTKVGLDGYVNLMLTVSDNTATIVLRRWLTPEAVNKTTASLGLPNTKVLWDHFPDSDPTDQKLRQTYGLGVTTPNEMNHLWQLLYQNKAGSPAVCDKLLRILSHQYWDHLSGMTVPLGTEVAIKNGAVDESRSENALVWSDHPYLLSIYTADQKDQQWTSENEGEVAIRAMCREIWKAFEPHRPFTPPAGYEKFIASGGGVE